MLYFIYYFISFRLGSLIGKVGGYHAAIQGLIPGGNRFLRFSQQQILTHTYSAL